MIGQEKREPDALRREAAEKDTRQETGRERNEREENGRTVRNEKWRAEKNGCH